LAGRFGRGPKRIALKESKKASADGTDAFIISYLN